MRSIVARRIQIMKTESLTVRDVEQDRAAIAAAVAALRRGEVVALPTETVYGLAALPRAEATLRAAKARDEGKPITWAVATREAAAELGDLSALGFTKLARRFWPGPLTLVAPKRGGSGTIGLRVPGHKVPLAVLKELGEPLLLTSANLSGEPDALDAATVAKTLDGRLPLILDAGPAQLGEASAVVSFEGTRALVHREGVIDRAMILRIAARHVLIVCSGNTCRSPMAEFLARKLWADALGVEPARLLEFGGIVQSAGTSAGPRMHAAEEAVDLLAQRGIDLSTHRSRRLDATLVRDADHVFAMTGDHRRAIVALVPDATAKVELLDPDGRDIADPIGGGIDVYRSSLAEIERALRFRIAQFV
jgi:tRNA threonylcarbamoyl adenosine modification protein (Sua5/YciO/YrdC/YwlC family)